MTWIYEKATVSEENKIIHSHHRLSRTVGSLLQVQILPFKTLLPFRIKEQDDFAEIYVDKHSERGSCFAEEKHSRVKTTLPHIIYWLKLHQDYKHLYNY